MKQTILDSVCSHFTIDRNNFTKSSRAELWESQFNWEKGLVDLVLKLEKKKYQSRWLSKWGNIATLQSGRYRQQNQHKGKKSVELVKIISNQNNDAQSFMWQSLDEVPGET